MDGNSGYELLGTKPQDGGESTFTSFGGNEIKLTGGKAGGFKKLLNTVGAGGKSNGYWKGIDGNNGTCERSGLISIIYTGKGGKSVITSGYGSGKGARRK